MKGCLQLLLLLILGAILLAWFGASREPSTAPATTQATAADPHGSPPAFHKTISGYTIPRAVERAVKQRLRDPDSFQITSLDALNKADWQGTPCYQLVFTYRARNALGGIMSAAAIAYIRDSQLLHIEFHDE